MDKQVEKKTVKELRGNRYTVEEMAEYLGIHKSNYSRKENGKTRFTLEEGLKLAERFGVAVEEIDFCVHDVAEHATSEVKQQSDDSPGA